MILDAPLQEVLNGPHTRVRVDTVAAAQVSPPGKKAKGGRQMGLASFYRGEYELSWLDRHFCQLDRTLLGIHGAVIASRTMPTARYTWLHHKDVLTAVCLQAL